MEKIPVSFYLPLTCFQVASLLLLYLYPKAVSPWHVAAVVVLGITCGYFVFNETGKQTVVLRKSPQFIRYCAPLDAVRGCMHHSRALDIVDSGYGKQEDPL